MRHMTINKYHPSGMTQERWDFPFKNPDERELVIAYQNNKKSFDESAIIDNYGLLPF